MTANVVIATSRRTNVLRVPNAALRFKAPERRARNRATAESSAAPAFDKCPPKSASALLAEFDKNGDGKLDADELKTMETSMRNRRAAMSSSGGGFGPPDGGPGGPPPGGGGGPVVAPAGARLAPVPRRPRMSTARSRSPSTS